MRILSVALENVKCFASYETAFAPGMNFICGRNGAGKSTLVEAVGLCVFGAGAGSGNTAYFLRDGAKSGEIAVRFAIAGEEYLMRRRLRAGSMPRRLFDGAGNELDLHGDADIDAFLRERLRLPGAQPLDALFNQVVGVRQGTLTQPFLQPPSARRKEFEAMLGVERYKNAAQAPSSMGKFLLERLAGHTTRIEVCRSHTGDLEETRVALSAAQAARAEASAARAAAQAQAEGAQEALRGIIEQQEAHKRAEEALAAAQARHTEQAAALARQREEDAAALKQNRQALDGAKAALAEAQAARERAAQAAAAGADAAAACAARHQALREQEAAALGERDRRLSAWQARLQELGDTARRARGGKCPFLNIPCTSVGSLDEAIAARMEKGEAALAALTREQEAARAAQAQAQRAREAEAREAAQCERTARAALLAATDAAAAALSRVQALTQAIAQLEARADAQARQAAALAQEGEALAQQAAQRRAARAGADPAALAAAQARLQALSGALGEATAREEAAQRDAERLAQELARKEALLRELAQEEAARAHTQAVQALYGGLAAMLREAGPRMAGVYRARLGEAATALYRGISGETARLVWTEDYDVQLMDHHLGAPRCRAFRQLSGGEQMSAALSLRFALLAQLAPIGMAFFDEPTANLDSARRAALASLLPRVTAGFEQVFVISHDDTFDAAGDSVIAL